jgi:predicted permease
MSLVLVRILPIFLLLGLGYALRVGGLVDDRTGNALKLLVVRVVLPSVLFLSFVDLELKREYVAVVGVVFAICLAGLFAAPPLLRLAGVDRPWARFLLTGYEYGMLGIGLFAGAYGLAAVPVIAVVAIGHEFFIWFVFFAALVAARDGRPSFSDLLGRFASNPVILAIVAGLALDLAGIHAADLDAIPGVDAVMATLRLLAPMTVPLILIVVGHGFHFEAGAFGDVARVVALRLALQIPLAALVGFGVFGALLGLEPRFRVALFTLMILPPPFIVPLFMPDGPEVADERRHVHRVLTVHTLVSLALFAVLVALTPTL